MAITKCPNCGKNYENYNLQSFHYDCEKNELKRNQIKRQKLYDKMNYWFGLIAWIIFLCAMIYAIFLATEGRL